MQNSNNNHNKDTLSIGKTPTSREENINSNNNSNTEMLQQFMSLLPILVVMLLMLQQVALVSGMPMDTDQRVPKSNEEQLAAQPHSHTLASHPAGLHVENETNLRLHKRHGDFQTAYNKLMRIPIEAEWTNPCRLSRNEEASRVADSRKGPQPHRRKLLRNFQANLTAEYKIILAKLGHHRAAKRQFSRHKYDCLPNLKNNTHKRLPKNVSLRRFYRDLQYYTAYFAYFERAQMHWDLRNLHYEGQQAKDLAAYKLHSSIVLCVVENAINLTSSHPAQIPVVTRDMVEDRMDFNTSLADILAKIDESQRLRRVQQARRQPHHARLRHANEVEAPATDPTVDAVGSIDLLFVKHYFTKYLRDAIKVLRQKTQKRPNGNKRPLPKKPRN